LQPFVLIECPRLLFPFAREIIATSVRNGGFQLLLNPIDFVALYRQRMAAAQSSPGAPASQPVIPS
jgi:preprotein translocase subunit SecB